jgi:hypothetical protein
MNNNYSFLANFSFKKLEKSKEFSIFIAIYTKNIFFYQEFLI